jgi:hypothetical protein
MSRKFCRPTATDTLTGHAVRVRRVRCLGALGFAWAALSGGVWAGSEIFGSLPGQMRASAIHAPVGQRVTVTLRLSSNQPLEGLKVVFDAPACAELDPAAVRREGVSLPAGKPVRFSVQAVIKSTQPCRIGATVLRTEEPQSRIGWVYAVVLNPKPTTTPGVTRGHDAQGRPTVDAIAQ